MSHRLLAALRLRYAALRVKFGFRNFFFQGIEAFGVRSVIHSCFLTEN